MSPKPASRWAQVATVFIELKSFIKQEGQSALVEISRRKPILKNRVAPEAEEAVVRMAFDYPAYVQSRACNELANKESLFVLSASVVYGGTKEDEHGFRIK